MRQLILFDNSHPLKLRIIAVLLQHANSDVPGDGELRWRFYRLKDSLLRKFGRIDAEKHCDWQVITNYCWPCEGTGGLYEAGGCRKCGGSGIYSQRWIPLGRWIIAGKAFHIPGEALTRKPVCLESPDIEGYVRHEKSRFAWISQCILGLIFDRQFAVHLLRTKWRHVCLSMRSRVRWPFRKLRNIARRCDVCRKHVGNRPWVQSGEFAYCSEECFDEAMRTGLEVPF